MDCILSRCLSIRYMKIWNFIQKYRIPTQIEIFQLAALRLHNLQQATWWMQLHYSLKKTRFGVHCPTRNLHELPLFCLQGSDSCCKLFFRQLTWLFNWIGTHVSIPVITWKYYADELFVVRPQSNWEGILNQSRHVLYIPLISLSDLRRPVPSSESVFLAIKQAVKKPRDAIPIRS